MSFNNLSQGGPANTVTYTTPRLVGEGITVQIVPGQYQYNVAPSPTVDPNNIHTPLPAAHEYQSSRTGVLWPRFTQSFVAANTLKLMAREGMLWFNLDTLKLQISFGDGLADLVSTVAVYAPTTAVLPAFNQQGVVIDNNEWTADNSFLAANEGPTSNTDSIDGAITALCETRSAISGIKLPSLSDAYITQYASSFMIPECASLTWFNPDLGTIQFSTGYEIHNLLWQV